MKIATAGSKSSKRWRTQDTTWDAILSKLRQPLRTGETMAEYRRMDKEDRDRKKGAAGGFVGGAMQGGRRVAGAVYERWLVTLDADDAKAGDWDDASCLFDSAVAVYSTHSHEPEKPRLRWIVPLRRAVSREEYEPLARKVAEMLGIIETLDATTYQPERLMYWPTAAQDGVYEFHEQDGVFLDPDAVLASYGPGEAWKDVSGWPIASREKEIVRREVRKAEDPTEKRGIVGAFCRTYSVPDAIEEFLEDIYEETGDGRYTYLQGSTSSGAVLYGDGLWLYSNHATDPTWGQLCNAFDLVRIHRYGEMDEGRVSEDVTKLPSYRAMCEMAAGLDEVKKLLVRERMERAEEDFADLRGDAYAETDGTGADAEMGDPDWETKLKVNHKTGEADPNIENALLILQNDPRLKGTFATNEFSARPVLLRDVPWRPRGSVKDKRNGEPWADTDDAGLRLYLESVWNMKGRQAIQDAWSIECNRKAFHPVRDYLKGLVWDGTDRLDTMLIRYMGAEDTEFNRAASRKWMCASVARVFEPGRKFDNMLVLVGRQGIGKSTLASTLSRGWFTDSIQRLDGKDAYESLRGVWIVELAELAATKRSETETIKNFITKKEDTYRPAYGRHTVVFPRQCVFYGTTNDPDFLKDKSGNRRFWPVEVEGFDNGRLHGLEEEVDQLWAEAVARYRSGEVLWMDDAQLMSAAREAQDRFTVQDDLAGMIQEYLEKRLPAGWDELSVEERVAFVQGRSTLELGTCDKVREVVSVLEIRMELLCEDREKVGRNDSMSRRIGDILNNLEGWKRGTSKARRGGYGPQRVYVRATNSPD